MIYNPVILSTLPSYFGFNAGSVTMTKSPSFPSFDTSKFGKPRPDTIATDVPGSNPLRSCGKPLPFAQLEIWDEHDRPVPIGGVGEIVAKTDGQMKGFWNNPEATAEVGSDTLQVRARVAEGPERDDLWTRQKAAYPQFQGYEDATDRIIPVVVLERT